MTKIYDLGDPEDFVAAVAVGFSRSDVLVFTADGEETTICTVNKDVAETIVQGIRTALGTWDGFTPYPEDPTDDKCPMPT